MSWDNIERTSDSAQVKDSVDEYLDPFGDIDGENVEAVETDEAEHDQPEVEIEQGAELEDGSEEQDEEEAAQSYDVPKYWTVEERELFDSMPEDTRAAFLELDKKREAFTTRKSQELSEEMRKAQAVGGIADMLNNDPNFRAYVAQYGRQQAPQQEVKAEEPPEDPIDRIKWEAKQELLQELGPQIQQMQQNQAQMQGQAQMQQAVSIARQDPQFNEIDVAMNQRLSEIAASGNWQAANDLRSRLMSDPQFYLQSFNETKARMGQTTKKAPSGKKVTVNKPKLQGKGQAQVKGGQAQRFKQAMRQGDAVTMMNEAFGDIS